MAGQWKKQRVTLEIVWNDKEKIAPHRWDWSMVTDESPDMIKVVGYGVPQDVEPPEGEE